ncbi:MAG: hypothetical protein JWS12_895 [Candidatus Saccharibacteria bacterium]|nr:hypothetical protein [Candidatus Saccharibacteria bacterium]
MGSEYLRPTCQEQDRCQSACSSVLRAVLGGVIAARHELVDTEGFTNESGVQVLSFGEPDEDWLHFVLSGAHDYHTVDVLPCGKTVGEITSFFEIETRLEQ